MRPHFRIFTPGRHLEHLECSHQPHIQGRGAKKLHPAGQMIGIGGYGLRAREPYRRTPLFRRSLCNASVSTRAAAGARPLRPCV